ncbi:hypothetical protein GQ55_2G370900 [Panicum hallii var. hallii]|uniref:Uncharacterized protein n=1 Tax=Panicum hallii var. hallii TaxID=1504633 RepID=A0A2T7EWG1_9POAL|nr:hypothetical protein GQ55_2G370900 [Panicum hallii var. hallii]
MTSVKCQTGAAPQFRQPVLREVVRRTTLHDPASDSGARNAPQRPAVGAAPRTCRRHCRPAQPTTRDLERRRSVVVPCRATASGSRERSWPGRRGFPPSSAARLVISARRARSRSRSPSGLCCGALARDVIRVAAADPSAQPSAPC